MSKAKSQLFTTFKQPVSFQCLEGCGLCCSYKVHLLPEDIAQIESAVPAGVKFSKDGCLLKQDGFCLFLDKAQRCPIYSRRPGFCRTFPFYVESGQGIDIDLSCPGTGQGRQVEEKFLMELSSVESERFNPHHHEGNIPTTEEIVRIQPGYINADDFKQMGQDWCATISDINSISEIIDSATALSRKRSPHKLQDLFGDFFDIVRAINIHTSADNQLIRYHFELEGEVLNIDGRCYPLNEGIQNISSRDLEVIREYLRVWFQRPIFYRFCLINSLEAPMVHSPPAVAFLFIAGLTKRIWSISRILLLHWERYGPVAGGTEILKEAIRMFDGRLRTKCRAVGVQVDKYEKTKGTLPRRRRTSP